MRLSFCGLAWTAASASALAAPRRALHALTDATGARTEALEINDVEDYRRTFVFNEATLVRVHETSFFEGKLGYQIWPAGIAGALWAASNADRFAGRSVLELGAGVGMFGCAIAAPTEADRVVLSDLDARDDVDTPSGLLAAQRESAAANGLAFESRAIDWTASKEAWGDDRFDVVVAADCVYAPEAVVPLAECLDHFLAPGGAAYVLSTERDWCERGADADRGRPRSAGPPADRRAPT